MLIVEDEFLIAMDLEAMCQDLGWQVIGPVGTIRDAFRLLALGLPTVALLDINLGGELVTPVAEFLTANGVPFAVASAHDKPEEYGGAILAGALNAGKPVTERKLSAALAQLLQAKETRQP